jgi:hypothetical protein
MARRTGGADLPLHGGRVPSWLATRMSSLGAIITQAIVHRYGRDEFLQRLSHPFWFQSFGALKRLDDQARRLERTARGPSLQAFIASERAASPELDGRSVFGWETELTTAKTK